MMQHIMSVELRFVPFTPLFHSPYSKLFELCGTKREAVSGWKLDTLAQVKYPLFVIHINFFAFSLLPVSKFSKSRPTEPL